MKFVDLNGVSRGVQISNYKWDGETVKSALELKLGTKLKELFPFENIYKEFPCLGTRLRLDFFLPRIKIAFEADGLQHLEYNPYFHGNRMGRLTSIKNDEIKQLWCDINDVALIRVTEKEIGKLSEKIQAAKNK